MYWVFFGSFWLIIKGCGLFIYLNNIIISLEIYDTLVLFYTSNLDNEYSFYKKFPTLILRVLQIFLAFSSSRNCVHALLPLYCGLEHPTFFKGSYKGKESDRWQIKIRIKTQQ